MSVQEAEVATGGPTIMPRGPKGLPVLGHLVEMGRDTLGFLQKCAQDYGDVTALQMGSWPALLINDSDLAEQVLVKQQEKFVKNRFFWRQLHALLGDGLFTSEGEHWQRQRRLSAPAFGTQQLADYAPHMVSICEDAISGWRDGQEFDLHADMMGMAIRIASKTLLGTDVKDELGGLAEAANWVIDEVAARFSRPVLIPDAVPLPGHIRYRRGIAYVDRMVYRIIAEKRAKPGEDKDFLGMMMASRDEEGRPMPDKQIRDEINNMLLAGYETTALGMSWAFHQLGQHKDIQDALAEEVVAVAGDGPVTHEHLPMLKLVEHVVIESLRLYPPAWAIGREAKEDVRIGSYDVRKGTTVILAPWVSQRDPRFFEDPDAFRPERWEGDFRRKLPRFAYFPFGGGPRICIGNRFAMMEAMLLLATIVRRFDITRMVEKPVTPFPSITLRPNGGVWVRLRERRQPGRIAA